MAVSRKTTIINKLGLHARAAARLVRLTSEFSCDIEIEKNGQRVNAKSIMGVMMLAASKGTEIVLHANGSDEAQAIERIEQLINNRFDEDE